MKKILFILGLCFLISCSRSSLNNITEPPNPTAEILSAVKVYAGGNPSIFITYKLTNTSNVTKTFINNMGYSLPAEVPTVDGQATVYEHGNFNNSANYYFIFNMKNNTQITSPIMTRYF